MKLSAVSSILIITGAFPARHKTLGVLRLGKEVTGKIVRV